MKPITIKNGPIANSFRGRKHPWSNALFAQALAEPPPAQCRSHLRNKVATNLIQFIVSAGRSVTAVFAARPLRRLDRSQRMDDAMGEVRQQRKRLLLSCFTRHRGMERFDALREEDRAAAVRT